MVSKSYTPLRGGHRGATGRRPAREAGGARARERGRPSALRGIPPPARQPALVGRRAELPRGDAPRLWIAIAVAIPPAPFPRVLETALATVADRRGGPGGGGRAGVGDRPRPPIAHRARSRS